MIAQILPDGRIRVPEGNINNERCIDGTRIIDRTSPSYYKWKDWIERNEQMMKDFEAEDNE